MIRLDEEEEDEFTVDGPVTLQEPLLYMERARISPTL